MTTSHIFTDPLDRRAANDVVHGLHGAPFDVLGPHEVQVRDERQWVVRVFQPGARMLWVLPAEDGADASSDRGFEAKRVHPAGLFSAVVPSSLVGTPYRLKSEFEDQSSHTWHDPYAFGPMLSEYDLYLLGEGTHYDSYERLGAHPRTIKGVAGVAFAVWAPNAKRVSLVGEFDFWDDRRLPMRPRTGGIWELFVPGLPLGTAYKYAILSWNKNYRALKADPYAYFAEVRPDTASRVWDIDAYAWGDESWMERRQSSDVLHLPMTIYELHVGSWKSDAGAGHIGPVTYRRLAEQLVPYIIEMGFTHVELMPIAEHPFDGSWGYQQTGYFAPTSRFGTPQDFMYFVDSCHQHGIGVILDWVPAHFPKDEHGLNYFDGTHLYEHEDARLGEHPDWGTLVFNYGRNEVANFLLSNALFWLAKYHIDGLRVDAVASMLYLDYSRKDGQWLPNKFGGRENLEAIEFLRRFNELVHGKFPGTLTVAEESTAWPQVSRPTYLGGLGFTFKWNMGWMHDILDYMSHDPIYRRFHQNELTFSMMYAFSENFVLPFSHDEVVHLKGSMLTKMPGDAWQKFANLRALYGYMYGHPGKKLMFMGGEFGQWAEWNFAGWLEWYLLGPAGERPSPHEQLRLLVRDLNLLVRRTPALYEQDFDPAGFEWIDCNDADDSTLSFLRYDVSRHEMLVFACNFTPVVRSGYLLGVPHAGFYDEILNTDSAIYGGSNVGNLGGIQTQPIESHGRPHSIALTLPPLSSVILRLRLSPDAAAEPGEHTTQATATHVQADRKPPADPRGKRTQHRAARDIAASAETAHK